MPKWQKGSAGCIAMSHGARLRIGRLRDSKVPVGDRDALEPGPGFKASIQSISRESQRLLVRPHAAASLWPRPLQCGKNKKGLGRREGGGGLGWVE